MKIRDPYAPAVQPAAKPRGRGGVSGVGNVTAPGAAADPVELSARSGEVQRARRIALAAPEVRQELVEALRGEIARGRYRVDGLQVAERMLREHLADASR